jgi:hypothetical protein
MDASPQKEATDGILIKVPEGLNVAVHVVVLDGHITSIGDCLYLHH